ncbi:hypothetical protein NVS55_39350 [Myxococcus stipitatus]|uniref:EGF domain-containing protein n=1 Tax=Myxococcus stipitatus TaxID=83455 RepID=UPI003144EE41
MTSFLGGCRPDDEQTSTPTPASGSATSVPPELRRAFIETRQREAGPAYALQKQGGRVSGHNEALAQGVLVDESGLALSGGVAGPLRMGLGRWGCLGEEQTAEPGHVSTGAQNEARITRGDITEWYLNGPMGVEQGFDVERRPRACESGQLALVMDTDGAPVAVDAAGGRVTLGCSTAEPHHVLTDLFTVDARGAALATRFERTPQGELAIVVDVRDAVFPVRIDPLVWVEEARLTPTREQDERANALFGSSVAISGNTAIVGVPSDSTRGFVQDGSAYVFFRRGDTWGVQQKLTGTFSQNFDGFGTSVAISGDLIIVGAPNCRPTGQSISPGCVYIFDRVGAEWQPPRQFFAETLLSGRFGASVAIDGSTAVVGAPDARTGGRAFVFVRASNGAWSEQQELAASDAAANDSFGLSVALSGNTVLVGIPFDDNPRGTDAGSADVFVRSGTTWSFQQRLTAEDGASHDAFGERVALDGDTAVIGVPNDSISGASAIGSAHVFVRSGSTWSHQQRLANDDLGYTNDRFGSAISLSGNTLVIGVMGWDAGAERLDNTGGAFVYIRAGSQWKRQTFWRPTMHPTLTGAGTSAAVSGEVAFLGVPNRGTATGANVGSVFVLQREGTAWSNTQELTATDDGLRDGFGNAVAVQGDTAVIGAPFDSTKHLVRTKLGSAYVFTRSGHTWSLQQKLTLPSDDAEGSDGFGSSVALSGNTVLIGAPTQRISSAALNAGSVYVFVRDGSTWSLQQRLRAAGSDRAAEDRFGRSVALEGDFALIGAPGDDTSSLTDVGSVYSFVRSGSSWSLSAKLNAPDLAAGDGFGGSVALSMGSAVIGASTKDSGTVANTGKAYVYVRQPSGVWQHQQGLVANDAAAEDLFGGTVAIDDQTLVVGALGDDHGIRTEAGSAYVFVRDGATWTFQAKLLDSTGQTRDSFGRGLAISGNTIAAGAVGIDTPTSSNVGGAYVYTRTGSTWNLQRKLLPADGDAGDFFGMGLALEGTTMLVGISADDVFSAEEGSVAVYLLVDHTCGNSRLEYPERCDDGDLASGDGCSATCTVEAGWSCTDATGALSVCSDINECATNNGGCSSNATCTNSQGSYACACKPGYSGNGQQCDDINECATNNGGCSSNATCTNSEGSFSCACKPGFEGDGQTCIDVNECAVNNGGCSPNGTCTNTPGSFSCTCKPGYVGNGLSCEDINECSFNNGGCAFELAVCTNTPGSFACACKPGYAGNGVQCTDVDECAVNNGGCGSSDSAVCTNTPGSVSCACRPGYTGDGVQCVDIDECLVNNGGCAANELCTNTPGGNMCSCPTGPGTCSPRPDAGSGGGTTDGGAPPDAGETPDAGGGTEDGGSADGGGTPDSGSSPDAGGTPDAGGNPRPEEPGSSGGKSSGCSAGGGDSPLGTGIFWALMVLIGITQRRVRLGMK